MSLKRIEFSDSQVQQSEIEVAIPVSMLLHKPKVKVLLAQPSVKVSSSMKFDIKPKPLIKHSSFQSSDYSLLNNTKQPEQSLTEFTSKSSQIDAVNSATVSQNKGPAIHLHDNDNQNLQVLQETGLTFRADYQQAEKEKTNFLHVTLKKCGFNNESYSDSSVEF